MESDQIVAYWNMLADEKWETAQALFNLERYADALFFCHLTLEAALKARVVMHTKEQAPLIHDLPKLAQLADIAVAQDTLEQLNEITTFNIKGRYFDYKYDFHKKATKEYVAKYLDITAQLHIWAKKSTQ